MHLRPSDAMPLRTENFWDFGAPPIEFRLFHLHPLCSATELCLWLTDRATAYVRTVLCAAVSTASGSLAPTDGQTDRQTKQRWMYDLLGGGKTV